MAECVAETICANCAHCNVCKWKEGFLKFTQMVNETQSRYGVCVAKPIGIECYEWLPQEI